ncbi:MAG: hypothetical protein WEA10_04910 [Actinomycetota bacterium]
MKEIIGRVQYGPRGFHQDASQAMKGDIVRALIETITNSDDAYGRGNTGKIRVEVEHRHGPWAVTTRDRAKGMSAARMKEAIEGLGGRTSGFEEGQDVRGNLGRGAKDLPAFGQVEFESICEGKYARIILEETGETRLLERSATKDDRKQLGIPRGNGTVVTMHVRDNIVCPRHARLKEKLSTHFQLRDILSDPLREVTLVDANSGKNEVLRYSYPDLPVVFSEEKVVEGYPEARAVVTIYRNAERFDDPPSDPGRPGGLLIKGRRAIYENTYFSFETSPHAGGFSGAVVCRYIDDLAVDHDRRFLAGESQDAANSVPIITRSRDGLEHNHPFYKKLANAIEEPLGELIAAEEERARGEGVHEKASLRRALDALGRDLARLIDEDLKQIDDEGLPPETGGDVPPLKLVPEQIVTYLGEDKTVTVQARVDLGVTEATAEVEPGGVVELVDGSAVRLAPHRRRPDLLTGQVRVRPLVADSETLLTVSCKGQSAVALVETRPEAEVVEVEVIPPESLEFERDSYRLTWTKKRNVRVVAPAELVSVEGKDVRVTSSEPGIVVLGGMKSMELDDEVEYYVAAFEVEARTLGSRGVLRAELGTTSASSNAVVTRDEEAPNLPIKLVDEDAGNSRAVVGDLEGQRVIKIMGRHPGLRRYLGSAPEFPNQDHPLTLAIFAEILAGEATRMVMERKYPTGGADELDAAAMYAEHMRYMKKYLARCHRALVPESALH